MNQKLCLLICFLIGVLIFYLLKKSCGCKVVEGQTDCAYDMEATKAQCAPQPNQRWCIPDLHLRSGQTTQPSRVFYVVGTPASDGGAECPTNDHGHHIGGGETDRPPGLYECEGGDGACPDEIPCTWSEPDLNLCNADCEYGGQLHQLTPASGYVSINADRCRFSTKNYECQPGEGECPPNTDCQVDIEATKERCGNESRGCDTVEYVITEEQSGNGDPCPAAPYQCSYGDGSCQDIGMYGSPVGKRGFGFAPQDGKECTGHGTNRLSDDPVNINTPACVDAHAAQPLSGDAEGVVYDTLVAECQGVELDGVNYVMPISWVLKDGTEILVDYRDNRNQMVTSISRICNDDDSCVGWSLDHRNHLGTQPKVFTFFRSIDPIRTNEWLSGSYYRGTCFRKSPEYLATQYGCCKTPQ